MRPLSCLEPGLIREKGKVFASLVRQADYTSTRPLGLLDAVSLLQKNFLLQILSGFHQIFRPAEITPIILIGPKGQDVFSVGSEMQIGGDDGENALFSHHRKNTRRNDVDAGKSQCLRLL